MDKIKNTVINRLDIYARGGASTKFSLRFVIMKFIKIFCSSSEICFKLLFVIILCRKKFMSI